MVVSQSIAHRWDGSALDPRDQTLVSLQCTETCLELVVDAPFFNDPPPPADSPLNFDGLWNYEVVEVFIKGKLDKYIEIEVGPHGHYLILLCDGCRRCVKRNLGPIEYEVKISSDSRWIGKLAIPLEYLPPACPSIGLTFNAFAIHRSRNNAQELEYCIAFPPTSHAETYKVPDFHRLELFQKLSIDLPTYQSKEWSPSLQSMKADDEEPDVLLVRE